MKIFLWHVFDWATVITAVLGGILFGLTGYASYTGELFGEPLWVPIGVPIEVPIGVHVGHTVDYINTVGHTLGGIDSYDYATAKGYNKYTATWGLRNIPLSTWPEYQAEIQKIKYTTYNGIIYAWRNNIYYL